MTTSSTRPDQPAAALPPTPAAHLTERLGISSVARLALFLCVVALACAHGYFYVKAIPPWDVIDEEQHLAYALTLRDEQRIPRIDEFLRQDIIDSAVATDRWGAFHMGGRPERTDAAGLGLEGRSYEAYQPPLYYLLLVPVTALSPHDALMALYLARGTGVLLLGALAAVAWALAAAWFPRAGPLVPASAGLSAASIPSAAAAAGRVNNDLMAAVLMAAGLLAVAWLVERPDRRHALVVGGLAASAALAKAHGRLLLPLVALALLILWRRGTLTRGVALAALVPGAVASLAVAGWTYHTYGVAEGTSAFLAFTRPFKALPLGEFLRLVTFNMWESYLGSRITPWLHVGGTLVMLAVVLAGVVGLRRHPRPALPLALTALLGLGLLAVLWIGNASGLVPPQGRLVLAIYPPLAALVAGGWDRLLGRFGALIPATLATLAAASYAAFWFYPFYHG